MGFVARVCQPSTFRMLIWPEASNAQNNMAAVSADGSTVCVLILRLNSSCSRSIALVVRALLLDQFANAVTDPGLDGIKPIVEKMGITLGRRMQKLRRRGNGFHGVVSCLPLHAK